MDARSGARIGAAAILLASLVALVLWLGREERGELALGEQRGSAEPAPGASELVEVGAPDGRSELGCPPEPSAMEVEALAAPQADPASLAPDAPEIVVTGRVLEGATREPLASVRVQLGGPGHATAKTDGEGRFRFELPSEHWRYGDTVTARVFQEEMVRLLRDITEKRPSQTSISNAMSPLFSGAVVLEPEVTLLARTQLELRGRLVSTLELGPDPIWVTAHVPASETVPVSVYAGTGPLDDVGSFLLEPWVDRVPPAFRLTFGSSGAQLLTVDVPTEELLAPAGALIELVQQALELVVTSDEGAPLAGVSLRLRPQSLAEGLAGETDPDGRARFLLPSGEVELCAGTPGHASVVERLEIPAGGLRHQLRLRRLGAGDRVAGRVVDDRGAPVEGAYASVFPETADPEVGVPGHAGVRTDAQGRFSLEVASAGPLVALAYHRELGQSAEIETQAGASDLLLVIEGQGALEAQVSGAAGSETPSGGIEWLLVDEAGAAVDSGHEWGARLVIEPIPAGRYELWVRLAGTSSLGSVLATVTPRERALHGVSPEPVEHVAGRLVYSTGATGDPAAGLDVALEGTTLPAAAAALWSTSRADGNGAFDLLLGTSSSGVLVVRDGTRELLRRPVRSGEIGEVEVRE